MKNRLFQNRLVASLTPHSNHSGTDMDAGGRFQVLPGTAIELWKLEAVLFKRIGRALALSFLCVTTAHGASLAYEGFDYPTPPPPPPPTLLNGQNGGSGFPAPWIADLGVIVQTTGLATPLGLTSTGFCIGGGFNAARQLSSPLNETEFWASFQVQASSFNDQVYLGFDLAPSPTPLVAFGRILDRFFIRQASITTVEGGAAAPVGSTDLLVARFKDLGGGATKVQLWVNTLDFTLPPLLVLVVPTAPYTWVNMQVQPGLLADEVRIGTTPADVSAAILTPTVTANGLTLTWPQGTLLQAPTVNGPWTTNSASSPYPVPMTEPQQYYRVILR